MLEMEIGIIGLKRLGKQVYLHSFPFHCYVQSRRIFHFTLPSHEIGVIGEVCKLCKIVRRKHGKLFPEQFPFKLALGFFSRVGKSELKYKTCTKFYCTVTVAVVKLFYGVGEMESVLSEEFSARLISGTF